MCLVWRFALIILLVAVRGQRVWRVSTVDDLEKATRSVQDGQIIVINAQQLELRQTLSLEARDVELRGNKTTLICSESMAGLLISSPGVRVSDLRFKGCRKEPAVIVEGQNASSIDVHFLRVIFEDNQLDPSILTSVAGEPLPFASSLLIRRCRVEPCPTKMNVTIEACLFQRNSADLGGALLSFDTELIIIDSTFIGNQAQSHGGAICAAGPQSIVMIENSTFVNNRVLQSGRLRPVFGSPNALPIEAIQYWTFPFPDAMGGAVAFRLVSEISISNSVFRSNQSPAGGAIGIEIDVFNTDQMETFSLRKVKIFDSIFESNRANFTKAEDLKDASKSNYNLGGAIYVVSNAPNLLWELETCTFKDNAAQSGGALHMVTHTQTNPRVLKCLFTNNSAFEAGGAILLRNTGLMEFSETNCTNNFAILGGCFLVTNNANLEVKGLVGFGEDREGMPVRFERNLAVSGGAVMCAACQNINLKEAVFLNNAATSMGGAVYVLESDNVIGIESATFERNIAVRGGAVAVDGSRDVRIRGVFGLYTHFRQNRAASGAAVFAKANNQRENRLEIMQSIFTFNKAMKIERIVEDRRTKAIMERLFKFGRFETRLVEALEREQQSTALECGEGGGGALCLALNAITSNAVADYFVFESLIENNEAHVGGGMYATVTDSAFWNANSALQGRCSSDKLYDPCRAFRFINVTVRDNTASEAAGGIFINKPHALGLKCALNDPGVPLIDAVDKKRVNVESRELCAVINHNSVGKGGFGNNIATEVNRLFIDKTSKIISNHTSGARLLPTCPNCLEDRINGISIRVEDVFGQVITSGTPDANLAVNIISHNVLGDRRYNAINGIINLNNTLGIGIGKTELVVGIEAIRDPQLATELTFSTRECYPGEEIGDIECNICPPLQYAFDPNPPGCLPCEENAVCTGGAVLVPLDGYWHSSPFSPRFHECIVKKACVYEGRVDRLAAFYADRSELHRELKEFRDAMERLEYHGFESYDQCAKGYTGILCGACSKGYGHIAGGECVKCPERSSSILTSVIAVLTAAVVIGANIFTTLSATRRRIRLAVYKRQTRSKIEVKYTSADVSASTPSSNGSSENEGNDTDEASEGMDARITSATKLTELMKILVNYMQVTSVALTINVEWKQIINVLLSIQNALVGIAGGSNVVPSDCAFKDDDHDLMRSIKHLWLRITIPLMILAFFILVCSLYACIRHFLSDPLEDGNVDMIHTFVNFKSYIIVIVIVVVFFTYINITTEFMRAINCIQVDHEMHDHPYHDYAMETKNRIWAEDTRLLCFGEDHLWTGIFGSVGLILFSLSAIVFICIWLPMNARRYDEPKFLGRYGFLYAGYKEKTYTTSWEAMIMLRKALVSAAIVYGFRLGSNLQGICVLGVLIFSLSLHVLFMPFKTFGNHPNVPPYAGRIFRVFGANNWAERWVRWNNQVTLNSLEGVSLMMSIAVFYSGIIFNDDNTSDVGKLIMSIFTFSMNAAFVGFILYRLYYGAHVAVNFYCDHLKQFTKVQDSIPEGTGPISLIKKGMLIMKFRSEFEKPPNRENQKQESPDPCFTDESSHPSQIRTV